MPLSKHNKAFGGKPGSAAKAKAAMAEEYGEEKGERVFYATANKRDRKAEHMLGKGAKASGRGR